MKGDIKPVPGRMIHFYPAASSSFNEGREGQPLAAVVAHVNPDQTVNLCAFSVTGTPIAVQSVRVVQASDDFKDDGSQYARWMPYQVGQAQKTEELSAALSQATFS